MQLIILTVLKWNKENYFNMKQSAIFVIIFCFFGGFLNVKVAASNCDSGVSQESCESFDALYKLDKVSKINFTKDSTIAEYCLHSSTQNDSAWELLSYEQIISSSAELEIDCSSYSISTKISLEIDTILLSSLSINGSGACMKTCIGSKKDCEKRNKKCKAIVDKNTYDYINNFSINSCLKGVEKALYLSDRYLQIKWDSEISCNGKKIPIIEKSYIYVSGFCSDEQVKKNKEFE